MYFNTHQKTRVLNLVTTLWELGVRYPTSPIRNDGIIWEIQEVDGALGIG